jgi:hypothetical protein
VAIQESQSALSPLDCFAIARPEGRASFDALWLLAIVSWISIREGCPRRRGCADSGGRPNRRAGRWAVSQWGMTPAVILVVFPLSSYA